MCWCHICQCGFCQWLWFISEDFCLFASSSVKSSNLVSWWCASLFEESQTLKLPELACVLSWVMLDENMPPAFYTPLWWPSGATFQYTWPDYFLSIQLVGFLCVGLTYLNFFFFRRCHGVSPPHRRPWPMQEDRCAQWQARGGESWLCRQETLVTGSWYLRLCFLSVKPRAGEQMHPEMMTPLSAPGSHCVTNCLLKNVLVPVCFWLCYPSETLL